MSRRTTNRSVVALLLIASLALVACGGNKKTGDSSNLQFDQAQADALTSTTAPTTTAAPTATTKPESAQTTQPRATTTVPPAKQEVTVEVSINAGSPYFSPSDVQVLVGAKVRFTNKDTVAHSVVSDTSQFQSGDIPPGGVWIYNAVAPGHYNYSDGGRPFAVGLIEVQ